MPSLVNPALAPGSTVLVTGANGFVAAHVADQLLHQGYKVRGTVRDAAKHQWLVDRFSQKYGSGQFELVTVKDMRGPGAFDDAVSGVSAVAHVASVRDVNVTPDEMIRTTVAGTLVCLQAAAKEPSVQRFVLTSSSRAVRSGQAYCNADTVSSDEFDNQTLALAKNLPESLSPLQKSVIAYFASKVASEQAFWDWVKTNKPHFTANAVVPCPIYGSPLDVPHQGYPSTSRIPIQVLDGHVDSMKHLQPHYVHVRDAACLHVAALIHPHVANERIFAFASPYSFNEFFDIFAKAVPGYQAPEKLPGLDYPLAEIGPRQRAEALLKEFGHPGFMGLEETIVDSVQTRINAST
ncbi:uncharacterized protein SETTUDRAFT_112128 [Exserohilum turcica Et28A]|uniref:NAD-dependent epimerase/dehydratase domain-containing protein n=1 Tax=Exserohilum turcicum (strain 28A) TaxID=671987 RepID=R0JUN8_EXST2|nr:uncharacterized protein SETTUDRAFT_112128 [Exserohilum turcica Et28A]EOA81219.1 hypothetical protein SETTUDRAFT_112128 [Exserohilum turcica Et28A]